MISSLLAGRISVRAFLCTFAASTLLTGLLAGQDTERTRTYADLGLKLTLPALDGLVEAPSPAPAKAEFTGKLGANSVRVRLRLVAPGAEDLSEPEDVAQIVREELWEEFAKAEARDSSRLVLQPFELIPGEFGWAKHAALFTGEFVETGNLAPKSSLYTLAGLLKTSGYVVTFEIAPAASPEQRTALLTDLRQSVSCSGATRDPHWTDAEATERWNKFAPPSSQMKLGKLVRTAHYIVMSNASGADRYGKKLEERYADFKKLMNFPELPSQRLLPVFYMRTGDEMRSLVQKKLGTNDPESRIDSFQAEDYLVTSADSDDEYEETEDHGFQLWENRVRASGAGKWLRDGFGELVGYPANTRTITASQLKKGRFTPLARLMHDAAWSEQSDTEMDYSEQACIFLEFLRSSKIYGPKFDELVRSIGVLPVKDRALAAETISRVLGADLKTLEKSWIDWCAKGRK